MLSTPKKNKVPSAKVSQLGLRLGIDRGVIAHVDDLGMSHGSNSAFLDLARAGHVTCGSVMVPCPWFREIAEAGASDPTLDLGVHLTLTSEWQRYRWRPMSTVSRASGLIDADGYMWGDVASLRRHLVPEAAEVELRAQLEGAIAAELEPTHIDAHMGAALLPELLDVHVRLARDYQVVPVLPRHLSFAVEPDRYTATVKALEAEGFVLPDHFQGTLPVDEGELHPRWSQIIGALPSGVTHFALHCTVPGDFEHIGDRDHASWRFGEYAFLARGAMTQLCSEPAVNMVGYREIRNLWWPKLTLAG
jgi:predicted glycoside hydrolase/deacetylase ChbG (UPF0249 family)